MRDQKRISRMLNIIARVWNRYPDLGLAQIILNCKTEIPCDDEYYWEDSALEDALRAVYNEELERDVSTWTAGDEVVLRPDDDKLEDLVGEPAVIENVMFDGQYVEARKKRDSRVVFLAHDEVVDPPEST